MLTGLVGLGAFALALLATSAAGGSDLAELKERRQRAAKQFADGVLLLHSRTFIDSADDGYREGAAFYYLTGLENSPGAILAIEGKTGDSWLFVRPSRPGEVPEALAGEATAQKLGLGHVVEWADLDSLLANQARTGAQIYYQRSSDTFRNER